MLYFDFSLTKLILIFNAIDRDTIQKKILLCH